MTAGVEPPLGEPSIDRLTEKELELHALELLAEYGWEHISGPELGPAYGVRADWDDLVLRPRLLKAIRNRYPRLPEHVAEDAVSELLRWHTKNDLRENHRFYERLTAGVQVPYEDAATGETRHVTIRPVDFGDAHGNDLVAASQVRVRSTKNRTFVFDIVLYVNGLPLAVVELKKADSNDNARTAYDQLQGYRRELKETGTFSTLLVTLVSDGITARLGTPSRPGSTWPLARRRARRHAPQGRTAGRTCPGADALRRLRAHPSSGSDRELPVLLRPGVGCRRHGEARQGAPVHRRQCSRPGH
ncbi:hypothetical protein SHKM778_05910 [Streptomyces sp. KM77-8]|uniref:type I site-specific deoxyribonuclease n=1 Tax=Streptomyces haneummycinicus TaxID=3074435 RepID=A0AAT9H9Y6_9ACTN